MEQILKGERIKALKYSANKLEKKHEEWIVHTQGHTSTTATPGCGYMGFKTSGNKNTVQFFIFHDERHLPHRCVRLQL